MGMLQEAFIEPLKIAFTVILSGFAFRFLRDRIAGTVLVLIRRTGVKGFIFLLTAALGLASGIITAVVAALVLAEIISVLRLEKKSEIKITVLACYSIGLGAALTPLGEPISTLVVSLLRGEPYHAGFFFLARLLGMWIVPGILALALAAALITGKEKREYESLRQGSPESPSEIVGRSVKVYFFVAGLILLAHAVRPVFERFLVSMPKEALYWINIISAVLDNATLAAAEISPQMSLESIRFLLMGLLISGGMLIPGNIPNIISAGKLGIKSREWAVFAVPLGLSLMLLYFVLLKVFA